MEPNVINLYLMVGKKFDTTEGWDEEGRKDLNEELAKYGLISNLSDGSEEDKEESYSVRGLSDPWGTERYPIIPLYDEDSFWVGNECPFGFCIGKIIYNKNNYEVGDALTIEASELSGLEKILKEVREDIPDAEIIFFSTLWPC